MRTVILIIIFAVITIIVGLLPANSGDPFGHQPSVSSIEGPGR